MKKLLVYLSLFTSLIAQDVIEEKIGTETINIIEKRIEKVEETTESIKKQYSVDLKEIENKYQEKEIELKKKLGEMEIAEKEREKKWNFLAWFAGIIGVGSVIGVFTFIKQSTKKIYQKISDELRVSKDSIEDIVRRYDEESKLRRTKGICILSVDTENKGDITKILKGFENRKYEDIREDIDFSNYDLILINHNDDYDMDKINKLITENSENYFFYYGSGRVNSPNMKKNFCNSIFTLYGNLIDLLRTQDLLNR